MSSEDLSPLLQQIQQKGQAIGPDDEQGRQALLSAARALVAALENPAERLGRMSWHEPTVAAAVRVGIDLNLFGRMMEDNACPKRATQLAHMTGSDPRLLERLLKHLATADVVRETGPDEYAANAVTKVLATPEAAGMVIDCHDTLSLINSKLAEFFKKTGYKNPTDKDVSAFKYAANTNLHYFEWLFQPSNAFRAEAFHNHMKFKTMAKKWYETVPIDELFGKLSNESAVLLVDIGGDTGHDILGFHRAYPHQPGRLILQDLPTTIQGLDSAKLKPVEAMAHDFFTPQPVRGAKAYYMKMVLHDWPDTQCREILGNIKPAMEQGYSKILINEFVIPDTGADWFSTSVDMLMMVAHSAAERRENDWRVLLESVGLKMVKIWDCDGAPEKLIEVELA